MKAWLRLPLFLQMALVFILIYGFLKYSIRPPLPGSVVLIYLGFIILGMFIYITLEDTRIESFISFFVVKKGESRALKNTRLAVLVLIPLLAAFQGFQAARPQYSPPAEIFQLHPSPPDRVLAIQVPPWVADPGRWSPQDIEAGKKSIKAIAPSVMETTWTAKGRRLRAFATRPAPPASGTRELSASSPFRMSTGRSPKVVSRTSSIPPCPPG